MEWLDTYLFRVHMQQRHSCNFCISKWNYIAANSYSSLIRLCHLNGRKIEAIKAMTVTKLNFSINLATTTTPDWKCLGERYEITHRANSKKAKSRKRS